jgi:hypothetical protein
MELTETRVTAKRLGIGVALVAVTIAISARSFERPGPGMDEGILVAYPELIRAGLVPGRDFESFYGPGDPYLVAGGFELFGASVNTERAIGLAFELAIVLAVFALLLGWGEASAFLGALLTAALIVPLGLAATAWFGAVALGLLGMATLARWDPRSGRRWQPSLAGLLAGLAIVFRPDLAPAVLLGATPLLFAHPPAVRRRAAYGFGIALIPLLAWVAIVGPHHLRLLVDDLNSSRAGRRLPLPGPASALGEILIASALGIVAMLAISLREWRADFDDRARTLLALGAFSIGLLPAMVQRADSAHVLGSGCVIVGLSVAAATEGWRARRRSTAEPAGGSLAAATGLALGLLLVGATVHAGGITLKQNALGTEPQGHNVIDSGRSFPIESAQNAAGLNPLLTRIDHLAKTGDSVFVGPSDLRVTNYADSYLYFLLPRLVPASKYTEVNLGTANADDSGLADELRQADFLLLTSQYETLDDPDPGADAGSPEPGETVRREFCVVAAGGSYRLFARRQTAGPEKSEIPRCPQGGLDRPRPRTIGKSA